MKTIIAMLVVVCLFGCANPSITQYDKTYFESKKPVQILVVRFEGNPSFVDESTDYFVSLLAYSVKAQVITMGALREESPDIVAGGNLASPEVAIAKAKEKKADLVVLGKVTSHSTSGKLNGFSTIHIYDVASGKRVGTFHRPSGMLFGYSEHQAVMKAVKRTANDTIGILK
jgi:hypothetical protein